MTTHSSKSFKLRYIHSIKGEMKRHHPKGTITISKSKSSRLAYIVEETKPLNIDNIRQTEKGASVS